MRRYSALIDKVSREHAIELGEAYYDGPVRLREPVIPQWLWPRQIDWVRRIVPIKTN